MALFGIKTKSEKAEKKAEKKVAAPKVTKAAKASKKESTTSTSVVSPISFAHLVVRPRVTEKAGVANEKNNVYTFEVAQAATKTKIAHAIKQLYKVTPVKVNIVNLPAKRVFVRGNIGSQSAVKKALVYLKKGDKIEIA